LAVRPISLIPHFRFRVLLSAFRVPQFRILPTTLYCLKGGDVLWLPVTAGLPVRRPNYKYRRLQGRSPLQRSCGI